MRHTICCSLLAALAVSRLAVADVTSSIDSILRDPYLKNVKVGIKIAKLNGDKPAAVVYEREPTRPLTPASNLKLVTTAAALDTLGPDFVFRTRLLKKDNVLALVGDGDPSLGDAEALEKSGWTSTTLFDKWAESLKARGITSVEKVLFDDSIFDGNFVHPNWPVNQIHLRYVAGVAGLNLNANCLDFYLSPNGRGATVTYRTDPDTKYAPIENSCVGGTKNAVWLSRAVGSSAIELRGQTDAANGKPISVTIDNPPKFAATVLVESLRKSGITVAGDIAQDESVHASADNWQPVAVYETPIAQILARANKDSMNLYAEALCKRVGAKVSGQPGSWANGTAAVGAFLESIGVSKDQYSFDDGCGLSKKNVISPGAILAVLENEYRKPHRDAYLASLAVAGVDGTLKERFGGTSLRERVIGKSGFVSGVSALAGFVKAKDGSTYIFSIIFNGIAEGTNSRAKQLQEKIVAAVD